jgi:hypothetical protein
LKYNFLILFTLLLITINAFAITDTNLSEWYKLDETSGTKAIDAKGYDNNAINTGATVNQVGKINTAYSFNGSNYLRVDNPSASTTVSYALWIKATAEVSNNVHYGCGGSV